MGIYDEPRWRRWVIPALVAVFILEVIALLPPPVSVYIRSDGTFYTPGSQGILWVTVHNGGYKPLGEVDIVVDTLSSSLEVNESSILSGIPPGGEQTVRVVFRVRPDSTPGDHLLRVFVSVPGETHVSYYKVRVA